MPLQTVSDVRVPQAAAKSRSNRLMKLPVDEIQELRMASTTYASSIFPRSGSAINIRGSVVTATATSRSPAREGCVTFWFAVFMQPISWRPVARVNAFDNREAYRVRAAVVPDPKPYRCAAGKL